MRSGKILNIGILKRTKKTRIKTEKKSAIETEKKSVDSSVIDSRTLAARQEDQSMLSTGATLCEQVRQRLIVRSKVQSIRDDFYKDGEPVMSIDFCYIPGGTFRMGRIGNFYRVTISKGYYLAKYPVTQDQWEMVMGNNPSDFKGAKYPVEQVSWEDCQEFVRRLNELTGKPRYRLPTEAEWEYACRAGSSTNYPFGDDKKRLSEFGWYHANSGGVSHPVGGKLPNAWGLHDMNGGVWEWCNDWYAPYPRWKAIDPQGPSSGTDRVLRGGSWLDGPKRCRSGFRSYFSQDFRCNFFGFRLVRKA